MSDDKSTTLEADEDEYPPEVIPKDDDEALDELYMPPCDKDNPSYVQIDTNWRRTCSLCLPG